VTQPNNPELEPLTRTQILIVRGVTEIVFVEDNRLLAEVRQQATGNRQQWEELEFFGIKLI
jgi:hypothetical protein